MVLLRTITIAVASVNETCRGPSSPVSTMIKVGWLIFEIVLQVHDQSLTAYVCCRIILVDTDPLGIGK
ncbi:MAG: hypothetical protein ACRD8Z_27350 [Nitrososphaeraceae archaeon]